MEAFNTFLSQKRSQININENKNPDRNRIYNYFYQLSEGLNGHSINQDFRNNPKKITVKQFNTLKETIDTIYKDLQIEKFFKLQNVFQKNKATKENYQISYSKFYESVQNNLDINILEEEELSCFKADIYFQIYAIDNYFNYYLVDINIIKYFYVNLNLQNLQDLPNSSDIKSLFSHVNNQQNNNQEEEEFEEDDIRKQVSNFFTFLNKSIDKGFNEKNPEDKLSKQEWNFLKKQIDLIFNILDIEIFCEKEYKINPHEATKENYQESIDHFFNPTKILSMKLILIILGILGIIIFFLTIGKLFYNKYNKNKIKIK